MVPFDISCSGDTRDKKFNTFSYTPIKHVVTYDRLLRSLMYCSTEALDIFHTLPILNALISLLFSSLYAVVRPIINNSHISSMVIIST